MEKVIRIRDHTVALVVATLIATTGFFAWRSTLDRQEVDRLRQEARILGRDVRRLEAAYTVVRAYTNSAERLSARDLDVPFLMQGDGEPTSAPLESDAVTAAVSPLVPSLSLSARQVAVHTDATRVSDLERFTSTHSSLEALGRDTEVIVRRLRSLALLLRHDKAFTRGIPSIKPVEGRIASGFGWRLSPFEGKRVMHAGVDLATEIGTHVAATADGFVTYVGNFETLGRTVVIDHGNGIKTRFGHLSRPLVHEGQQVKRGQDIALSGNTGHSTGPHVHYEVWVKQEPVDPTDFFFDLTSPQASDAPQVALGSAVKSKAAASRAASPSAVFGVGGEE
jgi:murein DD-endopeptidase MepM/ murein hydrolase activator NlpD